MYNNSFFKKILVVACVVFLYSCDKDYNSIGDGLLGNNHFTISKYTSNVVAYNQKIGPIQSNNLDVNALGIYDNPAFGTTTANFATQVVLETVNPTIGVNPVIESVVLSIPYFRTLLSTNTDGDRTFELNSIYGDKDGEIMLSVYESGFFMRDLDPGTGFAEAQKYYTNQNSDFNNVKVSGRLNNSLDPSQNDVFTFSADEYVSTTIGTGGKEEITRVDPEMRLDLDKDYFKTRIIDAAASGKLKDNQIFREYFRGLYFSVARSGSSSSNMALLDFSKGKITIKYKENTSISDATRVEKSIVLKLDGNNVGLLDQSNTNTLYANATNPTNVNKIVGDDKLYLNGGEGSMAIIELFNTAELATIRESGWLINEANLVFHVDGAALGTADKPDRIYLYDLSTNLPLLDYYIDQTTTANVKTGKYVFGGLLDTEKADDNFYKIRITNHIRNLIKNNLVANVKLGLVVTEGINVISSYKLKTATSSLSEAPKASVRSPLGTILFGGKSTIPANEDKRLKLEIYYTKPN